MKAGRFIQTLDHNLDRNFEYVTENLDQLLQNKNLKEVWNIATREGTGTHTRIYPEDMAITRSVVDYDYDSTGRPVFTNDTIIIKFTTEDQTLLLNTIVANMDLFTKMMHIQNREQPLHNPLPPIILP